MRAHTKIDVAHASQFARDVVRKRLKRVSVPAAVNTGLVYRKPPPWNRNSRCNPRNEVISSIHHNTPDSKDWSSLPIGPIALNPVKAGLDVSTVPELAHGLDVVLRQPGVHPMKAVTTTSSTDSSLAFSHRLATNAPTRIHQPNEINWANVPCYTRASRDIAMQELAQRTHGIRYVSSTSSVTTMLSTLYHALSNFGDTRLIGGLSSALANHPPTFAKYHKKPAAVMVRPHSFKLGTMESACFFSIDQHEVQETSPSILRDLGHSMERMLTMSVSEFQEKLLLQNPLSNVDPLTSQSLMDTYSSKTSGNAASQYYNYSRASSFLLRAQIDCRDATTGEVFDLKTRAVAPIRYDLDNYISFRDRTIRKLTGVWDSYEREFYDMVRSVFLKYSLQLRIGRMSGAFVTYHNTNEVIGYEFVSLEEMEAYIFGNKSWADRAFAASLQLFERVLDEVTSATAVSPSESIKVIISAHTSQKSVRVYAQRIGENNSDPLGPQKFQFLQDLNACRPQRITRHARIKNFSIFDSFSTGVNEDQIRNGIAMVSNDVVGTDATLLADPESPTKNSFSIFQRRLAGLDQLARDIKLTDSELMAWDLKLAPLVDGKVMSHPYALDADQEFQLKYSLTRSAEREYSLMREYIGICAQVYS